MLRSGSPPSPAPDQLAQTTPARACALSLERGDRRSPPSTRARCGRPDWASLAPSTLGNRVPPAVSSAGFPPPGLWQLSVEPPPHSARSPEASLQLSSAERPRSESPPVRLPTSDRPRLLRETHAAALASFPDFDRERRSDVRIPPNAAPRSGRP